MRRPTLKVVEYKHSKTGRWVIEGIRVQGKRQRRFFRTKTAADQELVRIQTKLRREGEEALALKDSLRMMALEVTRDLEPFGKTLRDAGDFYLKYLREAHKSISVEALVSEVLAMQKRMKRSPEHQDDLKIRLRHFCETFGLSPVRTITSKEIETWLHDLKLSPQSINNYRSRVSILFNYGVKRGYLERNPVTIIERMKNVDQAPEIFTVDELRLLLNKAPSQLLPMFAIGAFAGLRTAELGRLEWKNINLIRGFIDVPASKSKTARRRLITMAPNLRAWLSPYAGHTGKLWSRHLDHYYYFALQTWKAAGLTKWPNNGLRHSFASYHLAKHQDAPRLALDMGHVNAQMIFSNYREIVTPEEAERFWKIFPPSQAENVVPMTGGS
jgi:integrase